jgi:hypothetical protein
MCFGEVVVEGATVEGPAWCAPGLATRSGVYPLAVEQPVMRMVSLLVPGVTTLTTIARYFSLYWALADFADSHDFDVTACRALVRNAEVALAWLLRLLPRPATPLNTPHAHSSSQYTPSNDGGI